MTTFQLIVAGVFVALVVVGVGVFAAFGGVGGGGSAGPVVVWGPVESAKITNLLEQLRSTDNAFEQVTYIGRHPQTYERDLINAIAAGQGPDLFLVTQETLGVFADKILPIPYGSVSQSSYTSAFIDEAQLFLTPQGAYALPVWVDPLLMYWNRDLLSSAGVGTPPALWNDFLTLAPKITSLDGSSNVARSAVSMGTWSNIKNAKQILSTLFMQSGDFVTSRGAEGAIVPTLGQEGTESALRFYTEFGNPSKTTYSWNRSLPEALEAFAAGKVAVYFGFAGELSVLSARNPNLPLGLSAMPQISQSGTRITYGILTGVAVARGSKNPAGALAVSKGLSGPSATLPVLQQLGVPPARRSLGLDTSGDAVLATIVESALMSRGWLDPSKQETDDIFKVMIESVLSGRSTPAEAVGEAARSLQDLLL